MIFKEIQLVHVEIRSLVKRGPSEDEELNELANERQIFKALAQRLPHDQRSRIEALLMCFPQHSDHAPAKNQATARDVPGPESAGPADAPGLYQSWKVRSARDRTIRTTRTIRTIRILSK